VKPETQNWRLEPTGLAKQGKTSGLTGTGSGLARQAAAGRGFGQFWNRTYPFLLSKPGPLAGYPEPVLTLMTSHIRLYPLYPSNFHPPSLFLYHHHPIPCLVIPLYRSMPWWWVNTDCSIYRLQYTPSTAHPKHDIHLVPLTLSTAYTMSSIHQRFFAFPSFPRLRVDSWM